MKARNYPNLYRRKGYDGWVFRKYSSAKRDELTFYTGTNNEAQAYKAGCIEFQKWIASVTPTGKDVTIRDIAQAIIEEKRGRPNTLRSKHRHLKDHIIPAFGHLRPEQITATHWRRYNEDERRRGRTSLFNDRKALNECLNRAKEARLIPSVPKLQNFDPPAKGPRALSYREYSWLRREVHGLTKLLVFVMYWQGARPGEILQYEWRMIDWDGGLISIPGAITKTGRRRVIPLNSRVLRALRIMHRCANSKFIFPTPHNPAAHMYSWSTEWGKAIDRLADKGRPHDFSIYCLRDTFITDAIKRGNSTVFIAKYCDTSAAMIEKKYCAHDEDALRKLVR